MRQLTAFTLVMMMCLSACRQTSDEKAPVNPHAAESTPAVKAINKDNRGFTANTPEAEQLKQQHPLEYSCTMDLCGDEFQKYPSVQKLIADAATPTAEQTQYYQTYIIPALSQNNELKKALASKWLEVLAARDRDFATTTLNADQLQVIHTMRALRDIQKGSALEKHWNQVVAQKPFLQASYTYNQMGKWTYFTSLYPDLTLLQATQKELAHTLSTLARLNKIIAGAQEIDPLIVAKIQGGQLLDTEEAMSLGELASSVRILDHFLFGEGAELIKAEMQKHSFTTNELVKIYQEKNMRAELEVQSRTNPKNECESRYFQSINLYPQPAELAAFKNNAEVAREVAISLLNPQDPAVAKIKALKFVFPQTANENSTAWLRSLQIKNNALKKEASDLETVDIRSLFAATLIRAMFSSSEPKADEQCPRIPDSNVSDQTNPGTGYILTSWYSVKYPQPGLSLLAHEIGHTVHTYSNSQDNVLSCVTAKQSSNQYTGEDFADVFSARITQAIDSKYQIKSGNFACALMDDLIGFTNLNAKDVHSSYLYRALQMSMHSGKAVPNSCQQLASRDNPAATQMCH